MKNTVTRSIYQCETYEGFDKTLLIFLKEQNALPEYWKEFETWTENEWKDSKIFNPENMLLEFDLETEVEPGCYEPMNNACYGAEYHCCEIFSVKILKFYDINNRLCQKCGSKKHTYENWSYVCDDCGTLIYQSKSDIEQKWETITANVTLTEPLDITKFFNLSEDDEFLTRIAEDIWTEIEESYID